MNEIGLVGDFLEVEGRMRHKGWGFDTWADAPSTARKTLVAKRIFQSLEL